MSDSRTVCPSHHQSSCLSCALLTLDFQIFEIVIAAHQPTRDALRFLIGDGLIGNRLRGIGGEFR